MQDQAVSNSGKIHIDIRELIPQREPMVMITDLVEVNNGCATTCLDVTEALIFVQDGFLQESGLIENIAQTAAALNGYMARTKGEKVKNGYIGGIKNLEIISLPAAGSRLTTLVRETHQVMNTSIILGEVRVGDQLIATCEMKVFLQEK